MRGWLTAWLTAPGTAASCRRSLTLWGRTVCPGAALAVALLAGACGMSATNFSLPGAGSGAGSDAGTAAKPADSVDLISALSTGAFSGDDLIIASMAATAFMARGRGGPWENPHSGARGTITPIAAAHRDNGVECRHFLVSYVHDKDEAWMQGEACRDAAGQWEVRSLRPWRR
jgi:surface antigen